MSQGSETIRITDLARPILSELQQGARDYGDTLDIDLSRNSILEEAVAKTGVDIISIGALTHSAPSCDIGMDWSILSQ